MRERLPKAEQHAEAAVERFNQSLSRAQRKALALRLQKVRSGRLKRRAALLELWAIADAFGQLATPQSACKMGCAHCCHIPVALAPTEARLMGSLIGRTPAVVPVSMDGISGEYGYHRPCPFLVDSRCSVYAHRPLACRVHFNLDVDSLLCELLPDALVPVPYLNLQELHTAYVLITHEGLADIRDFFPEARLGS